MKYWVDLHIHSCLSPCAEDDMTPNNIVNMAVLKGLDIIAVTDHNSIENVEAVLKAGSNAGLVVVPGMELCTSEEIHLVVLFPDILRAKEFEAMVYDNITNNNREDIFGTQIIMNSNDEEIGSEERMLSGACGLDTENAIKLVRKLNGVVIPAHVNREAYSMLNTLGAIPEEYAFHYLECSKSCKLDEFINENPELSAYPFIRSSDAHFLWDILETEVSLELEEKSIEALLNCLR